MTASFSSRVIKNCFNLAITAPSYVILNIEYRDYQGLSTLTTVQLNIYGEPASKANSRQLVTIRGRPAFIKSKKARDYVVAFDKQCPVLSELIEEDVSVTMTIFYKTRRPDLDESVILDCMQGKVYKNDRQVKEKHIFWGLDKENPRAEILVELRGDKA